MAPLRPLLEADRDLRAGTTAIDPDLLLVRILAADPARARVLVGAVWTLLRATHLGRPAKMPTIWAI